MKKLYIILLIITTVISSNAQNNSKSTSNMHGDFVERRIGEIIYIDENKDTTDYKNHIGYFIHTTTNYWIGDTNLVKFSFYRKSGELDATGYKTHIHSKDLVGLNTVYKKNGKVKYYDLYRIDQTIDLFPEMKKYLGICEPCDEDSLILTISFYKKKAYLGYRNKDLKYTCTVTVIYKNGNHYLLETKNGKNHGFEKAYDENGNLRVYGYYMDGFREGLFKYYNEEGAVTKEIIYKNEETEKTIRYIEDGYLKAEKSFFNGAKHGTWKYFDKNGILKKEVIYSYGGKVDKIKY
jgi:antitoxin component YwqK of YwqJK toxin-antitoxin module